MAIEYPSTNDAKRDLWRKIAMNLYTNASMVGITWISAPTWDDNIYVLLKKITGYTAALS
jgi:hypothetical protein